MGRFLVEVVMVLSSKHSFGLEEEAPDAGGEERREEPGEGEKGGRSISAGDATGGDMEGDTGGACACCVACPAK